MNQIQNQVQIKKQKGQAITRTKKVAMKQVSKVELMVDRTKCTCQDFILGGIKCKHIIAYNITVLIGFIYELGINLNFFDEEQKGI